MKDTEGYSDLCRAKSATDLECADYVSFTNFFSDPASVTQSQIDDKLAEIGNSSAMYD